MEEDTIKKEKSVTPKKPAVSKKAEEDLLEEYEKDSEFDDQDEIHDESGILLTEAMPEPEYDENEVLLSWYDSDLNLVIDETSFNIASPLHEGGFCFLQAGARATYGYTSGKVCFEVKMVATSKLKFREGHLFPYVLRVGWSSVKSRLLLGRDKMSYGFENSGRISTIGETADYGRKFREGDVVGAYLDIGSENATISFSVNGDNQGIAYKVPLSELGKEPLFPHVLSKNVSYQCNFKGEKQWFLPKEGHTFVGDVPLSDRISGPKRPMSKSDCEVIMMCGLPKSGKTAWANELRDKNPGKYYFLDSLRLIDSHELNHPGCRQMILRKAKVMGKLMAIAMDRRRHYILDQNNIIQSEQMWKLGLFDGFKRRIVVTVLPDEEYMKKIKKDERSQDLSWLLRLKARFILPTVKGPLASLVDKIDFIALPEDKALKLVKEYHEEARSHGYKPFKYGMALKKKDDWKKHMMPDLKNEDFPNSADQVSPHSSRNLPARRRMREDWPPPPGNRAKEDWHSPPRKRMSQDRLSPPRRRMNEDWLPPPIRPDGGLRYPYRGAGRDDIWPQDNRREFMEAPPRFRPDGRREGWEGERSPPRSRIEEWQSRGPRMHGDRMSPPRRRPDDDMRPGGFHSAPPRSGMELQEPERSRNRIREREGGRLHYPDDNSDVRNRPPPGDVPNEGWLPHVAAMPTELHPQEQNMESMHARDVRMSSGMPPHEIRSSRPPGHKIRTGEPPGHEIRISRPPGRGLDEDFPRRHPARTEGGDVIPHHELGPGGRLPPQDTRMSGGYPPEDVRVRSPFPGSSQRMDNEFPPREARFGRDLPPNDERISGRMRFQEPTFGPDFQSQEHRMGEGYPHRDGRIIEEFPHRDVRIDTGHPPLQGNAVGPMRAPESQMARGFSPPHGRIGNDRPPPGGMPPPSQRRGGLAPNERRTGNVPPPDAISARSLSPGRRIVDDFYSPEDRSKGRVPPDRIRSGYPRERDGENEILPSPADRSGPFIPNPGERIGMLPPENRSGHMMGDLPPRGMSGDLPPSEGRMSDDYPRARQGRNLPTPRDRVFPSRDVHHQNTGSPHEARIIENFPSHNRRMMGDLAHHEGRIMEDLPPREGRMMDEPRERRMIGDLPPREGRMMGDFSPHEGRMMADLPPHEGRMMADLPPHEGRMVGDLPPHERRMMGDLPPREGRMIADLPSHEGRMMADLPPHKGRMVDDLAPREGRTMSNFPPRGERVMGNFPPREGRDISELPAQEGRMGGNLRPRERLSGDFPSPGGRIAGADVPPPHGRMVGDMPTGGRMMGNFPPGRRAGISDLPHRGEDMPPPGGWTGGHEFPQRDKFGNDIPAPAERMIGDLPLGGRMGSGDFPTEGRVGGGVPPHGRRFGSDVPHHGERPSGDLPSQGGRIGGGPPPRRGKFDGDLPPRDVGMVGDLQHLEGRSGSGDRWIRLPPNAKGSSNFEVRIKQEVSDESNLPFRSKGGFLEPKGGNDGVGPHPGHWDRMPSSTDRPSNFGPPIKQEPLKDVDLRVKEEFLQSKGRDDGRAIRRSRWGSPTRDIPQHPFKVEGDSQGSSNAGPDYPFVEGREGENAGRPQPAREPGTWKADEPLGGSWRGYEAQKPERPPPGSGRRSPVRRSPGRRSPARRSPGRRSPGRRSPGRRSPGRRSPGRRSPVRRSPGRRSPGRRSPGRRSPGRRSPGRRSPGRRSPGRRSPGRRSPGRKSPGRRSPGRKSPGRRSPGRKSPGRKSPGRRSPRRRSSGRKSPGRKSPGRKSPRRRSPGRRSPGRRSPGRRSPGSGRRSPLQTQPMTVDLIQPSGHNKPPPVGPRPNFQPPVGRPGRLLSPGQAMPGQQPPGGPKHRSDGRPPFSGSAEVRQSPVGRPESGRRSPVAEGSGGWQHGNMRENMHWQSAERSHIGEGARLPHNIDRPTVHNPQQKQPRISGPNVLYPDGEIEDDIVFGPAWKPSQQGGIDAKGDPVGSDAHVRLPEEVDYEELAPYEQPFNQSVWDSNEPEAGLAICPGSEGHAGRPRESGGSRPQYPGTGAGNKPPGSVWQRVGGYVDDDEERGAQDSSVSHHFGNQNPSAGHFGESKEGPRRRSESKEGPGAQNRFSPYRDDRGGFPRGGAAAASRGHWRSADRPRRGRW